MRTKRNLALAVVVCAAVAIIGGATARLATPAVGEAGDGYRPANTQTATILGERATEYWKARTRQDLYGAYPFYEGAFRSTYTAEAFVKSFKRLNRFSPELVSVDEVEVDAAGTRAKVTLTLRSTPGVLDGPELKELISTQEDVWILENGTWWRQAEPMTPTI